MHLFDNIIKPVLLYGAEIWADSLFSNCDVFYNSLKNDIIEQCHIKYYRYVPGVNRKAPNLGIYGGTGRYPITFSAALSFAKYCHRLCNANKDHYIYLLLRTPLIQDIRMEETAGIYSCY